MLSASALAASITILSMFHARLLFVPFETTTQVADGARVHSTKTTTIKG
jgi:hypothetical protein